MLGVVLQVEGVDEGGDRIDGEDIAEGLAQLVDAQEGKLAEPAEELELEVVPLRKAVDAEKGEQRKGDNVEALHATPHERYRERSENQDEGGRDRKTHGASSPPSDFVSSGATASASPRRS